MSTKSQPLKKKPFGPPVEIVRDDLTLVLVRTRVRGRFVIVGTYGQNKDGAGD